ncbi:MAG: hypothetical protein J4473_03330 [Candidatus Aenigmarchaeota archaeon]|nr:hypothetical protein [Candidatus Aenigmarchaeota archaeon]
MNIVGEKENKLLKRKEVELLIEHDKSATPVKAEIQEKVAKLLKTASQQIEIKKISPFYGKSSSRIFAYHWHEKTVPDLKEEKEKKTESGEKKSE